MALSLSTNWHAMKIVLAASFLNAKDWFTRYQVNVREGRLLARIAPSWSYHSFKHGCA